MKTRHIGQLLSGIAALSLYNQPPAAEGGAAVVPPVVPPVTPPAVEPPPVTPPSDTPPAKTPEQIKAENLTAIKAVLKLPDGSKIDPSLVEKIAGIASEQGLSPDQAKVVFDLHHQEATTFAEKQSQSAVAEALAAHQPGGAEYAKQQATWNAEALADPDLGNGNPNQLKSKVDLGRRVIAKFGDQQTIDYLEKTGLGSHPAVLKLMARLGAAMREDTLVIPGSTPPAPKDPASVMYPNDVPKS